MRNSLGALIFTDGRIIEIEERGDSAILHFLNYASARFVIEFNGVTEIRRSPDACTYEVMSADFRRAGGRWSLTLQDDDSETLLEVTYVGASVQESGQV